MKHLVDVEIYPLGLVYHTWIAGIPGAAAAFNPRTDIPDTTCYI